MSEGERQDARIERVARNEVLFREVNERIAELAEQQGRSDLPTLCECGRSECADSVMIAAADYEAVRAEGLASGSCPDTSCWRLSGWSHSKTRMSSSRSSAPLKRLRAVSARGPHNHAHARQPLAS